MAGEAAARHLQVVVVDTDTGEKTDEECPGCVEHETHVRKLESDLRGKRLRIAALEADRDAEARAHGAWPRAVRLFDIWREATGHLKAQWSPDRFWECLPALRAFDDYWIERAIGGLAYDPHTKRAKNGDEVRFDSWETLFGKGTGTTVNIGKYAERAPRDWTPPPLINSTDLARELSAFVLDRARLIEEAGNDAVAIARIFIEMDRRVREWAAI